MKTHCPYIEGCITMQTNIELYIYIYINSFQLFKSRMKLKSVSTSSVLIATGISHLTTTLRYIRLFNCTTSLSLLIPLFSLSSVEQCISWDFSISKDGLIIILLADVIIASQFRRNYEDQLTSVQCVSLDSTNFIIYLK